MTFHRLVLYETCIERWPSHSWRVSYGASLLLVQAVIPALVVCAVHARIASYLHAHARTHTDMRRATREIQRNRRTTLLLTGQLVLYIQIYKCSITNWFQYEFGSFLDKIQIKTSCLQYVKTVMYSFCTV